MIILCEVCDVKCGSYNRYLAHLRSEQHQEVSKDNLQSGSTGMMERTIVVSDLAFLPAERVLEYYSDRGFVSDIYFHKSLVDSRLKCCVVLMDTRSKVDAILTEKVIKMFGQAVVQRRRSEITYNDWNGLIRNPKEEEFEAQHKIMYRSIKGKDWDVQLTEFVDWNALDKKGLQQREEIILELKKLVETAFPACDLDLIPFGSFFTGLSGKYDDVDLFLEFKEETAASPFAHEEQVRRLEIITKLLRNHKVDISNSPIKNNCLRFWKTVTPVFATRIPIVRLIHQETNIQIDLSMGSPISIYNSKLIKFIVDFDPRIKPLLILIRYWGKYHHLVGCSMIKNYALILMIVIFLNQKSIIPNVRFIQILAEHPLVIQGWDAGIASDARRVKRYIKKTKYPWNAHSADKPVPCQTVLNLAAEFFEMYSKLNFHQKVLCPLLGSFIDKKFFLSEIQDLPPELPRKKVTNLSVTAGMCVQDPFCLDHNVTLNVTDAVVFRFQNICKKTTSSIKNLMPALENKSEKCILDIFMDSGIPSAGKKLSKQYKNFKDGRETFDFVFPDNNST